MFVFISIITLPISLLPIKKNQLVSLVYGLFLIAYLIRPEIGSDYESYFLIYNSYSASNSAVFDNLLRLFRFFEFPYHLLGILPLSISLLPYFFYKKNSLFNILFPMAVFYSFFTICGVNITKSALALSFYVGLILPIFATYMSEQSVASNKFSLRSLILIFLMLLFPFLIHAGLSASFVFYVLFCILVSFSLSFLPGFLISLKINYIYFVPLFCIVFVFVGAQYLLTSTRYSYYLVNSSSYVYGTPTAALAHSMPFLLFSFSAILGLFDPIFYPPITSESIVLSRFRLAFPMLSIGVLYILISMLGLNANIIGRTSIVYSFSAFATIYIEGLRFNNKNPFSNFSNKRFMAIKLLVTSPLVYRAISSYLFATSSGV